MGLGRFPSQNVAGGWLPDCGRDPGADAVKISDRGIKFIEDFESYRGEAYLCPAGVWTIGFGSTENVKEGDTLTLAQARDRLRGELVKYESAVLSSTNGKVTQCQLDALTSFCFNVGIGGMKGSTVIKCHNRQDFQAAARAFAMWNKVKGKPLAGLTRRRAAEAAVYLSEDVVEEMPQRVDAEAPMSASGINKAGIIAGGTAAVATVSETLRTVTDVKSSVDGLGDWLIPILLIVTICAVGYIVWERFQQRNRGQA